MESEGGSEAAVHGSGNQATDPMKAADQPITLDLVAQHTLADLLGEHRELHAIS